LQAAGIDLDQSRQLRQSDDAAGGIIGDMRLADEGNHVMFAVG